MYWILILSSLLSTNPLNPIPLRCISLKNQECKVTPKIVDINSNNPIFYPYSVKLNKCSGNYNNINDSYAKTCVLETVKDLNVKVFNLISKTNETRFIKWHETCKCICRLDEIHCNSKQRCNEDKCRCECKELIDKGVFDKGYVWNPSNCECECNKSCNIVEYCWKLIEPLVEECTGNINETSLVKKTLDKSEDRCNSCVVYKALFWTFFIFFLVSIGISFYFVYYNYVNRNKCDLLYQTII